MSGHRFDHKIPCPGCGARGRELDIDETGHRKPEGSHDFVVLARVTCERCGWAGPEVSADRGNPQNKFRAMEAAVRAWNRGR